MDEFRVRLRVKSFNKKLVPIDGGKYLRSQEVGDGFLRDCRTAIYEMPDIAGYAFVCWDSDGETLSAVTQSDFGPYEERDIPHVVKHEIVRALNDYDTDDSTDDETGDDEA